MGIHAIADMRSLTDVSTAVYIALVTSLFMSIVQETCTKGIINWFTYIFHVLYIHAGIKVKPC